MSRVSSGTGMGNRVSEARMFALIRRHAWLMVHFESVVKDELL